MKLSAVWTGRLEALWSGTVVAQQAYQCDERVQYGSFRVEACMFSGRIEREFAQAFTAARATLTVVYDDVKFGSGVNSSQRSSSLLANIERGAELVHSFEDRLVMTKGPKRSEVRQRRLGILDHPRVGAG